jgi:hypothetical protein
MVPVGRFLACSTLRPYLKRSLTQSMNARVERGLFIFEMIEWPLEKPVVVLRLEFWLNLGEEACLAEEPSLELTLV